MEPGFPSPMSTGLADPGAQCSDVRNMALSIEGVKNGGRPKAGRAPC